jgi:hypothetical protein
MLIIFFLYHEALHVEWAKCKAYWEEEVRILLEEM